MTMVANRIAKKGQFDSISATCAVVVQALCESLASFCEVEPMLEKMNTVAFDFDGVAKYDGLNLAVRNQIP